MKKTLAILLAAALVLALFAGGGSAFAEEVTVRTVDELIAAIAPGAVIRLSTGTFDLTTAESYGKRSGNPYVKWQDCWDGYELQIHDLDNLTILGSGMDATCFEAESRNAQVLNIIDCTNVTLSGFTAGHKYQAEGCSAGVVGVERSEDVKLEQLGLYGCGCVGVQANNSSAVQITDCDIYDCSASGINIYNSWDCEVTQCRFSRIGKTVDGYNQGYTLFSFGSGGNITVEDCSAVNCNVGYLLSIYSTPGVVLRNNTFADSAFFYAVYSVDNSNVVVESNNSFDNISFSRWYDQDTSAMVYDENDRMVYETNPEPLSISSQPTESVPVITAEQKQVKVETVDEFLAAIASNTEIILTGGIYDLSTAADYGTGGNRYYTWEDIYDGPGLIIQNVENFSIVSEDGTVKAHTISAVPRYANVLTFRNCANVMVSGFTAGHTVMPGSCMGGVLDFSDSTNCLVENCSLYGCGTLGVSTYSVNGLQVINSKIYECSYGGINCQQTENITIGGCKFWDLGGSTFQLSACSNVIINGMEVSGNFYGD